MTMTSFNTLSKEEAGKLLFGCCGSANWVAQLMKQFPFPDEQSLVAIAEEAWYNSCTEADWREAFTHHPKIGGIREIAEKFAPTKDFATDEQAGLNSASQNLLDKLRQENISYEAKFGFIFIVCATGKSAAELTRLLLDRITNTKEEELHIAMGEQHKITILRFYKMLNNGKWQSLQPGQITTHVLDSASGKPGANITIRLRKPLINGSWQTITQGVTNADGRIADLLPPDRNLKPGNYKMIFETENYFLTNNIKGFYPVVEIQFTVFDEKHYHVPLLLNPFGYTTYRGS